MKHGDKARHKMQQYSTPVSRWKREGFSVLLVCRSRATAVAVPTAPAHDAQYLTLMSSASTGAPFDAHVDCFLANCFVHALCLCFVHIHQTSCFEQPRPVRPKAWHQKEPRTQNTMNILRVMWQIQGKNRHSKTNCKRIC